MKCGVFSKYPVSPGSGPRVNLDNGIRSVTAVGRLGAGSPDVEKAEMGADR